MTRYDATAFDVESTIPVGVTIPQYRAARPRRRSIIRRTIERITQCFS